MEAAAIREFDDPHANLKTEAKKLEFTEEVERQALKLICTDIHFAPKWYRSIRREHWPNPWNMLVFTAVQGYFQKFQGLPSFDAIVDILKRSAGVDDNQEAVAAHLRSVIDMEVTDPEYIKTSLLEHGQESDYNELAMNMALAVSERRFEDVAPMVAGIAGKHEKTKIVKPYGQSADEIIERIEAELTSVHRIPHRFHTLNSNHGGGIESKALTVYMGPSGSGKSIQLCNDGAHFLEQGKTVYHFTFELSKEKTEARYDVILSHMTHEEREKNPENLARTIMAKRQSSDNPLGDLHVIEMPTGTCTPDQVQQCVAEHMLFGCKPPDVIILDYMTIMRPNEASMVDMTSKYEKHGALAEQCRALAMKLDIPVITAVQTTRGSLSKQTIKNDDIAESFAIIHVADLVLTINQTEQEKQSAIMRIFVSKSRNHADHYTIACDVNYQNLRCMENCDMTTRFNTAAAEKMPSSKSHLMKNGDGDKLNNGENPVIPVADMAAHDCSILDALNRMVTPGKGAPTVRTAPLTTPEVDKPSEPPPPPPATPARVPQTQSVGAVPEAVAIGMTEPPPPPVTPPLSAPQN